jgi:hypothetical protein
MTLNAFNKKIIHLDNKNMHCDNKNIGLNGSPTRVVKIETVKCHGNCERFYDENLDNGLNKMLDFIDLAKEKNCEKD